MYEALFRLWEALYTWLDKRFAVKYPRWEPSAGNPLVRMAKQLGNVSQACRVMGYSCDSFIHLKSSVMRAAMPPLQEISRCKPVLKNRVASEIEAAVVEFALEQPAWGTISVANELQRRGMECIGGWGAWHLATPRPGNYGQAALKALEAKSAQK